MSARRYGRRRTERPGNWLNCGSGAPDVRRDPRRCRTGLRGGPGLGADHRDPGRGHRGGSPGRRAERRARARSDRRCLHAARDDRVRHPADGHRPRPDRRGRRRRCRSGLGARRDTPQPDCAARHLLQRAGGSHRRQPRRPRRPAAGRRAGDRRDGGRAGVHRRRTGSGGRCGRDAGRPASAAERRDACAAATDHAARCPHSARSRTSDR